MHGLRFLVRFPGGNLFFAPLFLPMGRRTVNLLPCPVRSEP